MARLGAKHCAMIISRKLQQAVDTVSTPVISVTEDSAVVTAARLILSGKVIALPTDTIYGIAVSAQNNFGITKLYDIKKRDKQKPVAICLSSVNEIQLWGDASHLDQQLLNDLLPGAVTVVLKRKNLLNPLLNPHTNLIGIRIPKYSFIQNLSRACGVPLALSSANISSEPSPLEINEFKHLWPDLGAVFDAGVLGGPMLNRAGSTVVDLSEPNCFHIIRSGSALENTLATLKKYNLIQRYDVQDEKHETLNT